MHCNNNRFKPNADSSWHLLIICVFKFLQPTQCDTNTTRCFVFFVFFVFCLFGFCRCFSPFRFVKLEDPFTPYKSDAPIHKLSHSQFLAKENTVSKIGRKCPNFKFRKLEIPGKHESKSKQHHSTAKAPKFMHGKLPIEHCNHRIKTDHARKKQQQTTPPICDLPTPFSRRVASAFSALLNAGTWLD